MYTRVGARELLRPLKCCRNFAPAVLFVDEFDALGAARGAAAAGDESASIINELLVQVGLCLAVELHTSLYSASITILRP